VEDIAEMARRMEDRGRLKIDALVNNTNLSHETTPELILQGERIVQEAAALLGIPLEFTMARRDLALEIAQSAAVAVYPVDIHIRPVWL
jgi:hypothetical protein